MSIEEDALNVHKADQWGAAVDEANMAFMRTAEAIGEGATRTSNAEIGSEEDKRNRAQWKMMLAGALGLCDHLPSLGASPFAVRWDYRVFLCPSCANDKNALIGLTPQAHFNVKFREALDASIDDFGLHYPADAALIRAGVVSIPLSLFPLTVPEDCCDRCEKQSLDGFHEGLIQIGPALLSLNICEDCYQVCSQQAGLALIVKDES